MDGIVERLGYFEGVGDTKPAFDPGPSVNCVVCERPLFCAPVVTTSLMYETGKRSYFYRHHKECDASTFETAALNEIDEWETNQQ